MLSKGKKHSKTGSRFSVGSASPGTPSLTSPLNLEPSEDDIRFCLQEASRRYPSLIGDSAFVGRVSGVDDGSRGCRIWLSESSMVASAIAPGSIVSVSLAASGSRLLDTFPLSSLSEACERHFEVDSAVGMSSELGNYFTLATVFPSCKVLKNEVRLSSNLSHTMGCPAGSTIIFVYCVCTQLLTGLVNGDAGGHDPKAGARISFESEELYLESVPLKDEVKSISSVTFSMNSSAASAQSQSDDGVISSSKTPTQQNTTSSSLSHVASLKCEETTLNSSDPRTATFDKINLVEVLKDESAKQLLQICASSWLHSRTLLHGNLVVIPILSKLCIFRVISPVWSLMDSSDKDLKKNRGRRLILEIPESNGHLVDAFLVNQETKVHLCLPGDSPCGTTVKRGLQSGEIRSVQVEAIPQPTVSKLGGLDKEHTLLGEIILSSMKKSLSSLGLRATKGVLLHGPPGTGKTALARLCVHEAGIRLFAVNGPEIISQYYGESEQAISKVFDSAAQAAPAVVFIDDLDSIAPARKEGGEELSQRMVATLLNLMDGISRDDGLLVIAATNRPDSIEPALRRPGRLDWEIEIGVPSPKQRLDILHALLSGMEHSLSETQVQHLAMATHGFVGADLAALCNEAGLICLRHYSRTKRPYNEVHSCTSACEITSNSPVNGSDSSGEIGGGLNKYEDSAFSNVSNLLTSKKILPPSCICDAISEVANDIDDKVCSTCNETSLGEEESVLKVNFEDFEKARMKVRPSAMREVILEVPKVNWEDVGGQREVKKQLMEAVEWPQKHQDAFKRIGTRPPTGVLMFGPPGCSKTLMARAVASEAGLNFLAVKGPELFSKWVGESEKAVRSLFAKARVNAPSIIFFDEIDALAVIRGKESEGVSVSDRVMSQLLVELDGLHQRVNVTVIAATNQPDKIDPALLRPGRFDRLLYVGPPNEADREEIFKIHLRRIPCSPDVSIKELAYLTEGFTGADISSMCREAAIAAIEENIDASEITMRHLKNTIFQAQPSDSQAYKLLSSKFQRHVMSRAGEDQIEPLAESGKFSSRSKWLPIWTLLKSTFRFLFGIAVQS